MMRAFTLLFIAMLSAAAFAAGFPDSLVRIRGTVDKLDGNVLSVKTRDGQNTTVKLADDFVVMGITKQSTADIATGKFIGSTTVGEKDGALVAEEVHIFPENMRGTGEGHYDWDLRPNSKMTNANIAKIKNVKNDRVLTVQYKGGEKEILVTRETKVVGYTPSNKSELKPGAPIFLVAQKQPDGSLAARRVNVGLNGQAPPM
ncbi:MAG: hypothetical protein ACJ8J7_01460 [Sulfurifustaceae bacterium]